MPLEDDPIYLVSIDLFYIVVILFFSHATPSLTLTGRQVSPGYLLRPGNFGELQQSIRPDLEEVYRGRGGQLVGMDLRPTGTYSSGRRGRGQRIQLFSIEVPCGGIPGEIVLREKTPGALFSPTLSGQHSNPGRGK